MSLLSSRIGGAASSPPLPRVYPPGYPCQDPRANFFRLIQTYGSHHAREKETAQSSSANQRSGGRDRARDGPGGRVLRSPAQHFGVPRRDGFADGGGDRGAHPLSRA